MNLENINKNDYINYSKSKDDIINPLLNYVIKISSDINENYCIILPQMNSSKKIISYKNITTIPTINLLNSFSMPINRNNFLEIMFNIYNVNSLNDWFNLNNYINYETINLILNLFWEQYYTDIENSISIFINLNIDIIFIYLKKKLDYKNTKIIIYKLINNFYNKKINYLEEIKEYLK